MAKVSEGGSRKTHERPNRASASEAGSFVAEVDRLEQDRENRLSQIDAEFKKKKRDLNKSVNADIKAICDDAKKVGVKKGIIKSIVASQKRMRKHSEALDAAKEKASDSIDALGDDFAGFGLGAAAVEREGGKPPEPDAAGIAAHMAAQDAAKGNGAGAH